MNTKREQLEKHYATGDVPWDAPLPPPEVQETVAKIPPGRALDLGCGYGRAAIYLAQRGWIVEAIDFVALAVEEAQRRARAAGVTVTFHHRSISDLAFLDPSYDLALDVGCGHNLGADAWQQYHASLRRLLYPGGLFLLFSRLAGLELPEDGQAGPGGLDEAAFLRLFADGFRLERVERGETVMPDASWTSAWFWMRRTDD
jgi:cyclopropane fatty-acyl-phospholipid synthase-like methyltransferase